MLGFLTLPLCRASNLAAALPQTKAKATSLVSRAWTWVTSSFTPPNGAESLATGRSPASLRILVASVSLTPLLSLSTPPAAHIPTIVINTTRGIPTSGRDARAAHALRTSSREQLRTVLGTHHRAAKSNRIAYYCSVQREKERSAKRSGGWIGEWSSEGSSAVDYTTGTLAHL
ncbi:hypothetical protein RQP46_002822 [Phenoliferia psychrophenolica]